MSCISGALWRIGLCCLEVLQEFPQSQLKPQNVLRSLHVHLLLLSVSLHSTFLWAASITLPAKVSYL